ncbi:N-methyl-L-tryptophan oxidase [Bacillus sp. DTU_2020_1000418_1_SI_GHA_SEK_038]|uniref:N-methyl-L-tryptophan oxidase n=1 Tax=Bacillus sp. DTU_2020_1000418_1_SI_GHA_SEK_038 TaxID=3077585 RepID=UPI0028ED585E|nr:N-methyl-L-tryptophan oxidase [Bacillus sp. DTU_2020_1000418_1_SI_GHA_SEK_038]WNS76233.1 N-methyl-L-tryptophan oxidase [Bacillus sp. DTU_2020_1000418_1_SI_GHA_SEK_038]
MHYDVIVIGAGSMGMAAGYFLSKSGKRTLLIDSFNPPHNKGSHHGDTRIIRHAYGEGEEYVPLALKAQELWHDLENATGKQLFLQTGVLNVGNEKSDFIQNIISSSKRYALPLDVLDSIEVNNRWPGITLPNDFIGCFEPTSGVLKCEECIDAYRELAVLQGASILTNSKVKEIVVHDQKVTVKTEDQTFYSEALVVSAGAWSSSLLSMLDLNLPLKPVRKTFAWFDANEHLYNHRDFPAFAFETSQGLYYGFPSINSSGLKVGRHDGGEEINPDESILGFGEIEEDEADLIQFLNAYMPSKKQLKYGKTCMYTLTPDENFIIDLHPVYPNVAIASGFSGHGFKFSSVVGQILSELIISGKADQNISPFSIKRFKEKFFN